MPVSRKIILLAAVALLVIIGGGAVAYAFNGTFRTGVQQTVANITGSTPKASKIIITKTTTAKPTAPSAPQPAISPGAAPNVTKYAISSDPRSTAYSLTPPAPNPASFEIRITHNGQLAAGQLLAYNATKNDKVYYGGDLVFKPSNVTIHIANGSFGPSDTYIVTAPDGGNITMPHLPWYDTTSIAMPTMYYSGGSYIPPVSATSWNMMLSLQPSSVAIGTYQVHVIASGTNQADGGLEYDGFITLNIVDDTPL